MVWPCKKTGEGGLLGEVFELEVPGVRPRGSPKKQWKNDVKEDLREMKLRVTDAIDRDSRRANIKLPNTVV